MGKASTVYLRGILCFCKAVSEARSMGSDRLCPHPFSTTTHVGVPGLTRGLHKGQHATLRSMQCHPQIPVGAAERNVGDVPHHDIFHTDPVLPVGREALWVCGQQRVAQRTMGWPRVIWRVPGTNSKGPSTLTLCRAIVYTLLSGSKTPCTRDSPPSCPPYWWRPQPNSGR